MPARTARAKASAKSFDEGGWTFGQAIVWCTTHDLDGVRKCGTPQGYRIYLWYIADKDPTFPQRIEGQSDGEFWDSVGEYHKARNALTQPARERAVAEFTQALRLGRLIAIDAHGIEIPKSYWQRIDPNSPDARTVCYPSSVVRMLWPSPMRGKPTAEEVKRMVSEIYEVSGDGPKPKQESVRHDVRKRLPGATFRQINIALASVSKKFKNPIGRPKKIKTEN